MLQTDLANVFFVVQIFNWTKSFMKFINLIAVLSLITHWSACLQYFVPSFSDFPRNSWVSIHRLEVSINVTLYYATPHCINDILCHAMPYHAMPCHAIPYYTHYTTLYHAIPYIPCHAIPYHSILHTLYYTILYHTGPYFAIPCHTIPYHTIPYHTIPYVIIPHHTIPYFTIRTITYHNIPYHTIQYHITPHHITPYHTMSYHYKPSKRITKNKIVQNFRTKTGQQNTFGLGLKQSPTCYVSVTDVFLLKTFKK